MESERFVLLRSHYGFDSFYCRPGVEGAHEKGGVEGEIGRFRRRHLTPLPIVDSLDQLNEVIGAADRIDDGRRIGGRVRTVGEDFIHEAPTLRPLPAETFFPGLELECRVDHKARICVRQHFYSVPARFAGRRLQVRLGATHLEVLSGSEPVARHQRSPRRGGETLVLDHYLEVLWRKPGALLGATALAQAKAGGGWTPAHQRFWEAARQKLGGQAGTRAMIEVLLAHRQLPAGPIVLALESAVATGMCDPQAVIVEARRRTEPKAGEVIPIGALRRYDRPLPSIAPYDQLLGEGAR